MPQKRTTFWDELLAAAQGTVALVTGNRQAASYFDFSRRGLVGSFIAFLGMVALDSIIPLVAGAPVPPGWATRHVLLYALAFAMQLAFVAIVLTQMKRLDGLVPYLVADNWTSSYVLLAQAALGLLGVDPLFLNIATVVVGIILTINIARLILTLSPLQIGILWVAIFVGQYAALLLFQLVVPHLIPVTAAAGNLPA